MHYGTMRQATSPKDLVYSKFSIGNASYHFDEEVPYINYSKPHSTWQMDNGQKLPDKKYFSEYSYDAATRIFRGTILWNPATVGGTDKLVYEMVFSEDFMNIQGGYKYLVGKEVDRITEYSHDVHYNIM